MLKKERKSNETSTTIKRREGMPPSNCSKDTQLKVSSGLIGVSLCNKFLTLHRDAIQEITEGKKMYGEIPSKMMIKFRKYVTRKWLIISSIIQLVECWVKDSNECAISGEDESFLSITVICQSSTMSQYKEDAKEEAKTKELRVNQYIIHRKKGEHTNMKKG